MKMDMIGQKVSNCCKCNLIYVLNSDYESVSYSVEDKLNWLPVFPLESKKRTYTHIATNNFGRILIADGDYTENFGRFGPILRT